MLQKYSVTYRYSVVIAGSVAFLRTGREVEKRKLWYIGELSLSVDVVILS